MKRDFNKWLKTMRSSIASYKYYIDFSTVYTNAEKLKVELNILNSLIGSKSIENDFENLVVKYPEVLKAIPILLAKREAEQFCMDEEGSILFDFSAKTQSINEYKSFMQKTGLFNLMQNHIINNLLDYVLGVETGLNSNGRKNRGGHLMENLVESFIIKAGFVKGKTYYKEMNLSDLEKLSKLNLSKLSNFGSTEKRFDYVIIKDNKTYACECNFYASSGSKLNETARSYKALALESKNIAGFTFVWITDGIGWISARNNLRETFDVLPTVYNIKDLEDNILNNL